MEIGPEVESSEFIPPIPISGFATPSSTTSVASRLSLDGNVKRVHMNMIDVVSGNIAYMDSKVIVNPLKFYQTIKLEGEVAGAIRRACDPEQMNYDAALAEAWLKKKLQKIEGAKAPDSNVIGEIVPSDVVTTSAYGRLKEKDRVAKIIHVIEPTIKGNTLSIEDRQILKKCYENALNEMLNLGLQNIVRQ